MRKKRVSIPLQPVQILLFSVKTLLQCLRFTANTQTSQQAIVTDGFTPNNVNLL